MGKLLEDQTHLINPLCGQRIGLHCMLLRFSMNIHIYFRLIELIFMLHLFLFFFLRFHISTWFLSHPCTSTICRYQRSLYSSENLYILPNPNSFICSIFILKLSSVRRRTIHKVCRRHCISCCTFYSSNEWKLCKLLHGMYEFRSYIY